MTTINTKIPRRVADCDMICDNVVDEHGEIVHYVMLANAEQVDVQNELKKEAWRYAMLEELSSIEKNKAWELASV
jgi:hypothetical protein